MNLNLYKYTLGYNEKLFNIIYVLILVAQKGNLGSKLLLFIFIYVSSIYIYIYI